MARSQLGSAITAASESLRLVERGLGEKAAIRTVLSKDPSLRMSGKDGYDLMLGLMTEQDVVNALLESAVHESGIAISESHFLRLALYVVRSEGLTTGVIAALREISSEVDRPFLEYLFGFLTKPREETAIPGLGDVERIAYKTHNPSFWVRYGYRVFGRREALRILGTTNRPRYVRVNSLRNRGRVTIPAELKPLASELEVIEKVKGVYAVRGSLSRFASHFKTGLLQVQDLASFLAVSAAKPVKGERVLELCAAPGGKTAALAQFMRNHGRILSVDLSYKRLESWRAETRRLGVRIAEPIRADASNLPLRELFDLILIDPPCSGTGILDHNPQMKWRLSKSLVDKYSRLQTSIMGKAGDRTRPGGRIVYCTCSLTLEENENVISEFLENHPDFELARCLEDFGSSGIGLRDCRRFYPHKDRTAGYFVARLERSS